MPYDDMPPFPKPSGKQIRRGFFLGLLVVSLFVVVFLGGSILETNMAGYQQVKQAAITGNLECRLEPGTYMQNFGTINTYAEATTFYFTDEEAEAEKAIGSLPTRFNDGAKAQIAGSLRVMLPRTCEQLIQIQRKFHSMRGAVDKLVLPAVRKALFTSGPHMSAGESYAERRAEFAELAEDQLANGVIKTDTTETEVLDEITGEMKTVKIVTKRTCKEVSDTCIDGFQRIPSAFHEFGISISNFVIDGMTYPPAVLAQIEAQRTARMNIITQQAQAKEADARAEKAQFEAKAKIEETRAAEEVAKTQQIVRAEAAKEQARLAKEAAEFTKQKEILLGEGEATRKRLVMQADGALEKKLATYAEVQKAWAEAASKYPGQWVPSIVMGDGAGAGNGAQAMVDLLMAKTAKDLSLDMDVKRKQ